MIAKDLSDNSIREVYDRAVHHFHNSVFVELGCLCGASTVYLGNLIREKDKNIIIYAVDLWLHNNISFFGEFWKAVVSNGLEEYIMPIQADSAEASKLFKDKSIDFVYIDANHEYDYVIRDITYWLPKLKDKSWMAGHDYNGHVKKAVHRIFDIKAEIVKNNSWLVQFE